MPLIPNVNIPEGTDGEWRVEKFTVRRADAEMQALRSMFSGGRGVPEGKYTRLMRGGTVVMSDTPDEKRDHYEFVRVARGHVLINGLGLGMCVTALLQRPQVQSITIVEKSPEVKRLIGPSYECDRVGVVNADAFDYKPLPGIRFGAVWHDIWDNICADNLPEMHRLHRKYGRRTDWQGSWCRYQCQRAKEQYRKSYWG